MFQTLGGSCMTPEEARSVSDELVQQKIGYQLVRLQELLHGLSTDGVDPFACIVESYSRGDVERAANQVLTGQSVPKGTAECDHCGRSLSEGSSIQVRGRRPAGLLSWYIAAVACDSCNLSLNPEPDGLDVVATARLSTVDGDAELWLRQVAIEESSGIRYRPAAERSEKSEETDR